MQRVKKSLQISSTLVFLLIILVIVITQTVTVQAIITTATIPNKLWERDLDNSVQSLTWSPDGSKLAVCFGDKVLVLSKNGFGLWKRDLDDTVNSIAWSPDGSKLAVGGDFKKVFVFSINGKEIWEQSTGDPVKSVIWSPDGSKLAVSVDWYNDGWHGRVIVFSSDGSKLWESQNLDSELFDLSWSPNGTMIAVATRSSIIIFDKNGNSIWERDLAPGDSNNRVNSISWSPKGDLLAVSVKSNVIIFDKNGNEIHEIKNIWGHPDSLLWSPQGDRIAVSTSWAGEPPWGKVIVFSSNGSKLWEQGLGIYPNSLVWSPDGDKLAVGTSWTSYSNNYSNIIIFSNNGEKLWDSKKIDGWLKRIAWSPSGSKLAVGVGSRVIVYDFNFGFLIIKGNSGSAINIKNNKDKAHFNIPETGVLVVYASPGTYTINYSIINKNINSSYYIGGPLVGTINVSVNRAHVSTVNLPNFSDLTGVINITANSGTKINISGPYGSKEFAVPRSGYLVLYASPGTYTIIGNGKSVNVTVKAGRITNVELYGFISRYGSLHASILKSVQIILLISLISISSLWYYLYRIRRARLRKTPQGVTSELRSAAPSVRASTYKSESKADSLNQETSLEKPDLPITTPEESLTHKPAVVTTLPSMSSDYSLGLKEIMEVVSRTIPGVRSGYGCSGGWSVRLSGLKPRELNGYYKCCRLGCGGWGCAYKCTGGGRTIVVKVPEGYSSFIRGEEAESVPEKYLLKVIDKAETLSELRHPRIVRLLGYHRGIPLLVYEYAPYGSLAWQLSHGWEPSLKTALLVGLQVGDALRYIHSRGLVHGDIKPGNVFIGEEGWAKLGDFSGIVRLLSKTSRSKMPHHYTYGFRAPEQVFSDLKEKAKNAGVENRIDVYQLGNLLLYLLTGDTVDGEEYTEAEEKLSEVGDPELRSLLRQMLAKDPLDRPSIEQVLPRLARIYKRL